MTRRYADPVQVMRRQTDESEDGAPAMFLWRGRLYVVREVLGHWWERRAWWTGADARAVHGEVPADTRAVPPVLDRTGGEVPSGGAAGPGPDRGDGGAAAGAPGDAVARSGADREVWRVAASPGSAYGTGVYDLSEEGCLPEERAKALQAGDVRTACGEGTTPTWRLLRVAD